MPASLAYSSSSGGAVGPGAARGQPKESGSNPRLFKQKKIFVTNGRTHERKDGQTDVTVEMVM